MRTRTATAVAVAVACAAWAWGTPAAWGHAALQRTDPAADVALDAAPTAVRLSFTEQPERSLSSVRVVDAAGTAYHEGEVQPDPTDARALTLALRPLDDGAYTVVWRVVSAVDGHPTAGAYAFGVGVSPAVGGTSAAADTGAPPVSWQELVARWAFLAGVVLLLGAATATAVGFGGPRPGGLGWVVSAVGLVLLAEAQRRNVGASPSALWDTAVGRDLAWRAVAVAVAGATLVAGRGRRLAAWATAAAAAAAVAVHVAAGHAAGGAGSRRLQVLGQWSHFVAAAVWVGGLVALLLAVRGAASEDKADAVRRFSAAAAVALALVVATGLVRSFDQVPTWADLTGTAYGRAVLAKVGIVAAMATLGGWNRWRSVPRAATALGGLRRRSVAEVGLGAVALAAASVLATVAPPAGEAQAAPALHAQGTDFGGTVRVRLDVQPGAPGRNRFVAHVGAGAVRVFLRFRPLDDPGVPPSTLELRPEAGPFVGNGANLAFAGRWGIDVLVDRGGDSTVVPLELNVPGTPQFLSIERIPGRPVRYTVEVAPGLYVRIHVENGAAHAQFFDDFGTDRPVDSVVLTTTAAGRTQQHVTRRLAPGRVVADLGGRTPAAVAVVARAPDGTRLRAAVDLDAT